MILEQHLPSRFSGLLAETKPPYFIGGTKAWVWYLGLVLALVMTLVILGFVVVRVSEGKAGVVEWVMGIFCLPFLIALLQPKTWIRPIWMIADMHGLYFFGSSIDEGYTFVPWHEVSKEMSIERIPTGSGLTKGIVIKISGNSSYWNPAMESRFIRHLLQPVEPDGYRRLPLTSLGHNLKRSLTTLSYLRQYSPSLLKYER